VISAGRRPLYRLMLVIVAAAVVSALAVGSMIGFAALTKSTAAAVVGGVLVAVLASWVLGLFIWRDDREATVSPLRRGLFGPMAIFGCAAVLSLSWLYPGSGGVRPDPVPGLEWLNLPDGSRLALHITRAPAATQPPIIVVHGGPGVADMAHDAPAFASLATDRDVYVYDRIGTGASSRLPDPTGYTTARAVQNLEAVRVHTGAPRVVLHGHSWGARFAVAYAQEQSCRRACVERARRTPARRRGRPARRSDGPSKYRRADHALPPIAQAPQPVHVRADSHGCARRAQVGRRSRDGPTLLSDLWRLHSCAVL